MYISCHFCCADSNECSEPSHNCTGVAQCENDVGSFHCTCPVGYTLDASTTTCDGQLKEWQYVLIPLRVDVVGCVCAQILSS